MDVRFRIFNEIEPRLQLFPEYRIIEITPEFCQMLNVDPGKLTRANGQMDKIVGITSDGLLLESTFVWQMPLTATLVAQLMELAASSAERSLAERLMSKVRQFRDGLDYALIRPILTIYIDSGGEWDK